MVFYQLTCTCITAFAVILTIAAGVNPSSDMSGETVTAKFNKTRDLSMADESGHEEMYIDEMKDKRFLDDAMKTVLDPNTMIVKHDELDNFKIQLENIIDGDMTLDVYIEKMENISLDICKASQEALWSYVSNTSKGDIKKNKMIRIVAEEDEIKKAFWRMLEIKYSDEVSKSTNPVINRKIRIIQERGINALMNESKHREDIEAMQRIWSQVTVCAYNVTVCSADSIRTMSDILNIFRASNDSKELAYYWKAYRDSTGKKIRPIFKDYVKKINLEAITENFDDAGDMWRYSFEDDNFVQNIDKIWLEIKPLYKLLHDYVRAKLKVIYKEDLQNNDKLIPAHLLGNLWAQEWQAVYPTVAACPNKVRPELKDDVITSGDLFALVDNFHRSLGFESARDAYEGISDTMATDNCLPSSHDMCDGNYRIKWCGEKIIDVTVEMSRAARLLSHIQYFKHYQHLPFLFRDGPNPAFHDAISDIAAIQLTSPNYLKKLSFVKVDTGRQANLNHLVWVALEKLPLMAYAYVLDKWRWDVFSNGSIENLNQHWWDLRIKETGVSPPVPRDETDLDPAAKYHVVSNIQYITYLVSHVLEFQLLQSLCKAANQSGPLHECSIYGSQEAGKLLSAGMSLGATKDWRTVLQVMTGETELSTKGFLEYFSPLQKFLKAEVTRLTRLAEDEDMDKSVPIIVGVIVICLTLLILLMYCIKKHSGGNICVLFMCCLRRNGSLDIIACEAPQGKTNQMEGIVEDKV